MLKDDTVISQARMFEYFPGYYPWNMSILMAFRLAEKCPKSMRRAALCSIL